MAIMHKPNVLGVLLVLGVALWLTACPVTPPPDRMPPSVAVTSTADDPTETSPIPVTVAFSESVTGFEAGDLRVTNALVQGFSGTEASYSFELVPEADGLVTVNVDADVACDAAGNGNLAAAQFRRTYIAPPPVEPVVFTDPTLEAAVRAWFIRHDMPLGEVILSRDLVDVGFTRLSAAGQGIADLTGLEYATDLVELNLFDNNVSDLAPLGSLVHLQRLELGYNAVQDLAPLAQLTDLDYLGLGFGDPMALPAPQRLDYAATDTNQVVDVSPLGNMIKLRQLNLFGNATLTDASPLAGLTGLKLLYLGNSPLSDLSFLSSLNELEILSVFNCGFGPEDFAYLDGTDSLFALAFGGDPYLSDVGGLASLDLSHLILYDAGVSDIGFAAHSLNLDYLDIRRCPVADISPVAEAPSVSQVTFEDCNVSDLTPLAGLTRLAQVRLPGSEVTDLTPLLQNESFDGGLYLDVSGNPLSADAVCNQLPLLRDRFEDPAQLVFDQFCTPRTLTITVSGTGHTSLPAGPHVFEDGDVVHLSAWPAADGGFAFAQWQGDVAGTTFDIDVAMDSDKAVEAVFVPGGDWTLVLQSEGGHGEEVEPAPGAYQYFDGQQATLRIAPIPQSRSPYRYFAGWEGDLTGSGLAESIVMDSNKSVTAVFDPAGHHLDVRVQGYGSTEPLPGVYRVATAAEISIDAVETGPYSRFFYWHGLDGWTDPHLTLSVDDDALVVAVFPRRSLLSLSVEGGGTTMPAPGTHKIPWDDDVVVEAVPEQGWYFDHWEGDWCDGKTARTVEINMQGDVALTAVFLEGDWDLVVEYVGGGRTEPPEGIRTLPEGRVEPIVPQYVAGWDFDHWEGDISTADPYARVLYLPMDTHRLVTAVFVEAAYELAIQVDGPGSTIPSPGVYGFADGRDVTVYAYPFEGARFIGWEGAGQGVIPAAHVAMDADKTLTAVFETIPEEEVTFAEPAVEAAVRAEAGVPDGPLFTSDVVGLGVVEVVYSGIESLEGIEILTSVQRFNCYTNNLADITPMGALTNLTHTDMASNRITDLGPLAGLPFLQELNFGANWVSDLSPLTDLPALEVLVAFENDITDIGPLAAFSSLRHLNLDSNQVTDIGPLAGLTRLEYLRLQYNQVSDIAALSGLTALENLGLAGNPIVDISPLEGLRFLTNLNLSDCQVSDITVLSSLTNLDYVFLSGNLITDLSPLLDNPGIGEGDVLYLLDNPLGQEALCTQIPALEARGVEIHVNRRCQIGP